LLASAKFKESKDREEDKQRAYYDATTTVINSMISHSSTSNFIIYDVRWMPVTKSMS